MALRRKTCQHYSDPSEKIGEDGKHYYSGKCISCNEQIVGCLLCNYSFAESAKACYSTDAYFNRHMGRKHKEMLHRSKIQKTNNVSLPEHNDEYDFGDQDNDTTECFDDETSFIVDYVPEEVKEREAKEDDDSVPTLASRAESASDEESVISFEGDDDGKEINDDDDDLDSVIIPNPSDAIADSDYIPPRNDFSPVWESIQAPAQLGYGYEDFAFFCENTDPTVVNWVDNNQLYFWQKCLTKKEDSNNESGGWRGLCHRAITKQEFDRSGVVDVEMSELLFHLNDVLLNTTSKVGHSSVMSLVDNLCSQMQNTADKKFGNHHETITPKGLPRTYNEARRVLIDGGHSVLVNFPAPSVFTIDNHACVSLKQTIQMIAGHRGGFDFIWDASNGEKSEKGLNGTMAAKDACLETRKVLKKLHGAESEYVTKTSIGWVSFWSDSFLKSFVKQKDNSVWLYCVTISPPKEDISKGIYTQVLAIGKSGQDHTAVVDHFYNEIKELEKGFQCYYTSDNNIRHVAFSLLYHSADRPERQSILNTLGEGTYGKVTNYAMEINPTKFPACKDCYKRLISNLKENTNERRECNNCFCWNINPNDPKQQNMKVPKGYPQHKEVLNRDGSTRMQPPIGREPGRKHIGPIRLSTEWLMQACEFAYEARRQRLWTQENLIDYLRTCCVSLGRIQIIDRIATEDWKNKTHSSVEVYCPKIWLGKDCFDRCLFPDMPMHALAHGMGGDVMEFFHNIFTNFKVATAFGTFANKIIHEVASFRLDWCKPKSYPRSGWVGENIMAFLRLSSYLYGMYLLNHPLPQEQKPLQAAMQRMLNAYLSMLSILMSVDEAIYKQYSMIENSVKLFMTASHYCDLEFIPNETNTTTKKKIKAVDLLSLEEIHTVLHSLHVTNCGGKDARECLDAVTTNSLKRKLESIKLDVKGTKPDLQLRLFSHILDRSVSFPCNNDVGTSNTSKTKTMVWDKGAWVSFTANIGWQIKTLGPLIWIWYVFCLVLFL